MFNNPWYSIITAWPTENRRWSDYPLFNLGEWPQLGRSFWLILGASGFLVSVPVFFQAPLVRFAPYISLALTLAWLGGGMMLFRQPRRQIWGDLLIGFTWSWLAGSIYWGWWRHEPLIHLPIEAIALPFALWGLKQGWGKVGNCFYLGSLLGTAITDLYFYLTGLIPYWREVMSINPQTINQIDQINEILAGAIAQVQTPWGISCAIWLLAVLFTIGLWALQQQKLHWWAFGGAVLSTILVDGLFWLTVSFF